MCHVSDGQLVVGVKMKAKWKCSHDNHVGLHSTERKKITLPEVA